VTEFCSGVRDAIATQHVADRDCLEEHILKNVAQRVNLLVSSSINMDGVSIRNIARY